jgi:hypothetical protein
MVYGLVIIISNVKISIISNTHSIGLITSILLSLILYALSWVVLYESTFFVDVFESL